MDSGGDLGGDSNNGLLIAAVAVVGGLLLVMFAISLVILISLIILRRRSKANYTTVIHSHGGSGGTENILLVELNQPDPDDGYSKGDDGSAHNRYYENVGTIKSEMPKIIDYEKEIQGFEWDEVTLRVNFTGSPRPNVTWTFEDPSCNLEEDYAIEMSSDGSLLFVCIEKRHEGRYYFEVNNALGTVSGSINVIVIKWVSDEEHSQVELPRVKCLESNPITKDEFGCYVEGLHSMKNRAFIEQFESLLPCEHGREISIGTSETNIVLNRFRNIVVYDDCCIPLSRESGSSEQQHDYINASYIDGYSMKKEYLATQGPLLGTVTDFWRLVWQEGVQIIAMVTNTVEHGSVKCEKYWPESGISRLSGSIRITSEEESIFSDYVVRNFNLKKGNATQEVVQYHFTSWPDHGVPEYAGPILNYLRRIKAQHKPNKGPILVHCSAGVGRTGTLIAIDTALAQASKERQVDIPKIIVDMRKQRMKMVQTADQYALIHDAVLETMICGETQIQPHELCQEMKTLTTTGDKHQSGKSWLHKQFEVLTQVSIKSSDVDRSSALIHSAKNRSNNFLPPEEWRVKLNDDGYIHASFANGYKQKKGFIIAQSPMDSTARDFVKMLYERECGVVVMLCGCQEGGVEVCAQYWPTSVENGIMSFGEFIVKTSNADTNEETTRRVISITNNKSEEVHKVTQFQLANWNTDGTCSNPQTLIDVIDQMNSIQRRTGNKPIVVHGRDTVSRVGVFCSVVNAIEMCKTEGVVDVFQVVKALRIQKPGAVQTVEQYRSIFDLMQLFLDSFNIYSNFK